MYMKQLSGRAVRVECRGIESQKSDCLGRAVLLCYVVCLTLLASFFLPSHLSLKHVRQWFLCTYKLDE